MGIPHPGKPPRPGQDARGVVRYPLDKAVRIPPGRLRRPQWAASTGGPATGRKPVGAWVPLGSPSPTRRSRMERTQARPNAAIKSQENRAGTVHLWGSPVPR